MADHHAAAENAFIKTLEGVEVRPAAADDLA